MMRLGRNKCQQSRQPASRHFPDCAENTFMRVSRLYDEYVTQNSVKALHEPVAPPPMKESYRK